MLFLNEEFTNAWQDSDPFERALAIEGVEYRRVKNRRTLQFSQNGNSYFLKLHSGVGWLEIIKNLLQFRLPVISAENEWIAIERLQKIGVATMTIAAYGRRGSNPASIKSFIITEDLVNTVSLEEYCADWQTSRPSFLLKQRLLIKVAEMAGKMHRNGVCHRDFYICHFLLHKGKDGSVMAGNPRLSLIDLHRAISTGTTGGPGSKESTEQLGKRWIEKDIAGLYFSAMDIGITRLDRFRFMCAYKQKGLRETLEQDGQFWNQVNKKAKALYRKHGRPGSVA